MSESVEKTPLYDLHLEQGGKMVSFGGYLLPIQYTPGILAEHKHCRQAAALFDVSHMGQALVKGFDAISNLESLLPADLQKMPAGRMTYSLLTNDAGGIRDDLMVARREEDFMLVVNAACKDADFAYIAENLGGDSRLVIEDKRAMLALQGPKAADVMARHITGIDDLRFLSHTEADIAGISCRISRSGYTGEDGYEISMPGDGAQQVARLLLDHDEVAMAGLGARDSLRLEAGLCLYGHDLDETTTPVEAGLTWAVHKRRRLEGGFPGADVILRQIAQGPTRKRVGLKPQGRAPLREGVPLYDKVEEKIGIVTSGGFGPTHGGPVAMGYVATGFAEPGTAFLAELRGRMEDVVTHPLPFVPHNYYRGSN